MRLSTLPRFFVPPAIGIVAAGGFGMVGNMATAAFPQAPNWVWQLAFWGSAAAFSVGIVWLAAWIVGLVIFPIFGIRISRDLPKGSPDMPGREAFAAIDPDYIEEQGGEKRWETVGQDLLDKLATGRLRAWGRQRNSTGTLVEMNDPEYWKAARWTYQFFDGTLDSPNDVEHSRTKDAYRDVQFSRGEILSLWPKARGRIKWPDYDAWRGVDPIKLYQAACLWWDIEPTMPMPEIARNTFGEMRAFLANQRTAGVGGGIELPTIAKLLDYEGEYRRILDTLTPDALVSRADLVAFTRRRAHRAKFLDPQLSAGR